MNEIKIAVLGDTESIKGFSAVGLKIFPCEEDALAADIFKSIVSDGYGLIFVTEHIAEVIKKEIEKYNTVLTPSIVPIPGIKDNNGIGVTMLKAAVEKAVGSDIVFNKE